MAQMPKKASHPGSTKSRKSRFERTRQPDPLILQPRDKELITGVYEYRFLSRTQIQRLFDFKCITRVNIRLRKLFDHRYLSRRFLPTTRGSAQALYCLGDAGIPIVAEKLGLDPQEVKKKRKDALEVKDFFLAHDLLVNDVRIATTLACKNNPHLQLVRWLDQSECRLPVKVTEGSAKSSFFSPDGYCQYKYNNKLYACFLELDRSTMSNQRFLAKAHNYLSFGLSGSYQEMFGMKFFRVFVVTLSHARLLNLKKAIEGLTDRMFWLATVDQIVPDRLFDQVWYRAGHSRLFSPLES